MTVVPENINQQGANIRASRIGALAPEPFSTVDNRPSPFHTLLHRLQLVHWLRLATKVGAPVTEQNFPGHRTKVGRLR